MEVAIAEKMIVGMSVPHILFNALSFFVADSSLLCSSQINYGCRGHRKGGEVVDALRKERQALLACSGA